jgi:predicted 2-oxoglutarate/Fe(II)-dependent dioxygenase YbiX
MMRDIPSDLIRSQAVEKEQLNGDRIFGIRDFLTPKESERLISWSEETGYADAPITTAAGPVMFKSVRNNDRLMVDAPDLAAELFERAQPYLVPEWFGWHLVGFNERWRFYRYDPGQRFKPHYDGYYQRPNGERSHFTFMMYLNEGAEGGETVFGDERPPLRVRPTRGTALVFYHKQLHEGAPVIRGRKYVLRTDVMYRPGPKAIDVP